VPDAFDVFLAERVLPQHRPIVLMFRDLVGREAPELVEGMRGGSGGYPPVPVYRGRRDVIVVSPSKAAITFSFANGAGFDDPYGLLSGAGKASRTVRVRRIEDFPQEALADYVLQAAAADAA
jgi:hypothetical protein